MSARNIKTTRPYQKLDSKFLRPFKILERVGNHAYRLELPPSMQRLHPVFNVVVLEDYTARPGFKPPAVELADEWEVERIVAHRLRHGKV